MAIIDGQPVNAAASNPAWVGQEYLKEGMTLVAASGGTTTLTSSSTSFQIFTGTSSTTQNCKLPDATTLVAGRVFRVMNRSSAVISVYKNDGTTLVLAIPSGNFGWVTCTSVGNANGTWDVDSGLGQPTLLGNSIVAAANVTGLAFDRTKITSVVALYEVSRSTTTSELVSVGKLSLFWRPFTAAWDIVDSWDGDDHGITWSITSGGQVQYVIRTVLSGSSYIGAVKFRLLPFGA